MKKSILILSVVSIFALGTGILSGCQESGDNATTEAPEQAEYVCPMHPDEKSDTPDECSKCGMALEKK